ncbi:MAG: hypothetical protein IJZ53_03925 [Tyzzerella sp.]|nr:hypothetical protein [Tyzzerella sp.]
MNEGNREKKKILLLLLLLLLLIGAVVGIFLGLNKRDKGEKVYQITILESAHGSVEANQYEAKAGEEIVLTVAPDEGYELSSLTVNGEKSETTFKMPAEDVKVLAKFALITDEEEAANEGENFGSSEGYVTTEGVDLSHDNGDEPYISVVAGGPQYAYVKDVYTEQLMFEATFKVKEIFNEDEYPKFGIMINGTTEMVKFYVDLKTDLTCESVGVVHQPTGGEDDWTNAYSKSISKLNLAEDDVTLKLVRDGENYYFYVNDVLVLCEKGALNDEKTAVGVFSFNTAMDVSDYSCLTGTDVKSEITQAKKDSYPLMGDFFGKSGSYISSDVIDFSTDHGKNSSLVLDAKKGTPLYTYINDFTSKQFYFETEVKVSDILSNENYPKFGLLVQDSKEMVKFYLDTSTEKQVTQAGVVHQLTGKEDDWANQSTALLSKKLNLSKDTVKLALLRNGTAYYFYVNDELILAGNDLTSQSGVAGVFSFGTTLTLTNYKLVKSGSEYNALLKEARAEAELSDTFKLTQNYFAETENGVYKLSTNSADESKVDDVMLSGSVLKAAYYSIKGKLTLSGAEDWAQARILISSDEKNEYVIALEQTGKNQYQIFTMSKDNEGSWNDWRLIESAALNGNRNSIDFEVVVNGDKIYFLVDDEICYTSDRVDMTESTVKFSSYKKATTTVENLDGEVFDSQKAVEAYLATKSEKAYETQFQSQMNALYQEYFVKNDCAGHGGTLLLGSSTIDFWDNWETQTGLTNYVNGYNVGVGGTTAEDWLYAYDKLIKPFGADRFVIFVGGNDVSVWGDSGEEVTEHLRELFTKIHEDFPDSEIYYIYSLPTPSAYVNGSYVNTKYGELIEGEKALCKELAFVEGIDTFDLLVTEDKLNSNTELFREDNIHMNTEGYRIWSDYLYDVIFKGETFGVTVRDGVYYKTTNGIELINDVGNDATVEFFGTSPRYAYLNDIYTEQFYFETDVELTGLLTDDYPKLGLLVNGETEMVKFYLDINKNNMQVSQVGVVHQATGGDDDWANQKVQVLEETLDLSKSSVKLAVLRDGQTYYFYINDKLVTIGESLTDENGAVGVFSFNAVMTLSNYRVAKEGGEYEALLSAAKVDAEEYWSYSLTTNYFAETTEDVYTLTTNSADESKVDDVKHAGNVLRETYYSVKGTLTLTDAENWSQARLLISADEKNEHFIALEQTATDKYQIFTMSKNNETGWNDWRLIESAALNGDRNSIDFEVIVNGDKIYFLIDDEICYISERVSMAESTVKFSSYKNATTTVENLDGQVFDSQEAVEDYLATKNEKPYETQYEARINALYNEYFVEHDCAGQGGTLLLGSSTIDFWDNWEAQTGLTNYVNGYNVGIGGTTTEDWLYAYDKLIKPFGADRFVIFVGGNDVSVWGDSGEEVAEHLKELFIKIHTDFPDSEIYYIYSLPTPNAYVNGSYVNTKYGELIEGEKALCEELAFVEGIDTFDLLVTEDKLNSNTELFRTDNIHMNTEGYEVWSAYLYDLIFKGEFWGNVNSYSTSSGVDLSYDTGANTGTVSVYTSGTKHVYVQDFYESEFYLETKIHVNEIFNDDQWPKFGLFVRDGSLKVNFYVDMKTDLTSVRVGRMNSVNGSDDWTTSESVAVSDMSFSGDGEYITLGVLKDGKYLHFFVDGQHAISYESSLEGKVAAGVFGFNTGMELKEYYIDQTETTKEAMKKLLPRYGQTINGNGSNIDSIQYDADTDTISINMADSNSRTRAALYENGVPVQGTSFAVTGHIKIENTKASGSAASKVEFQVGKSTGNFVKMLVYRYQTSSTKNNSVYVEGADSNKGGAFKAGYAMENADGTFSLSSSKQNNLAEGDPYEVDYKVIYENGTVYLVLDGELVYRYEGSYAELEYSFGVTQYADVTWTNTEVVYDENEVAVLADPYRLQKGEEVTLTTNNFSCNEISGIYSLETSEHKTDTVQRNSTILNETYYRIGGTIINNSDTAWAQSEITVKADDTHAVRFVLERTDKGYYQIFTENNFENDNWQDWTCIINPNNKTTKVKNFDIVVIKDKIYLLINDQIYYSAEYAGIFETSYVTIGGQNVSMKVSALNATVFEDKAAATEYIESKEEYAYVSAYKNTINNKYNAYFGTGNTTVTGGTLLLGSSTIDYWGNTKYCGAYDWETMTGLVDGVNGYNVGIGGTIAEDWLYAYDKLIAPFDASRFVIFLGGNNISVNDDSGLYTAGKLTELLEKIHENHPDAEIYYIYSQPTPNSYANGVRKSGIAELINEMKEYCNNNDWVTGVDTFDVLTTEDGLNPKDGIWKADNVHMNEEGYRIWSEYLRDIIFKYDVTTTGIGNLSLGAQAGGTKVTIDLSDSQYDTLTSNPNFYIEVQVARDGSMVDVEKNGKIYTFTMPGEEIIVSGKYYEIIGLSSLGNGNLAGIEQDPQNGTIKITSTNNNTRYRGTVYMGNEEVGGKNFTFTAHLKGENLATSGEIASKIEMQLWSKNTAGTDLLHYCRVNIYRHPTNNSIYTRGSVDTKIGSTNASTYDGTSEFEADIKIVVTDGVGKFYLKIQGETDYTLVYTHSVNFETDAYVSLGAQYATVTFSNMVWTQGE